MGFAQHRPCRGKKWAEKGREHFVFVCLLFFSGSFHVWSFFFFFFFFFFFRESFCICLEVFFCRGLPRKSNPGDPGDASHSFDFPFGSAAPGGSKSGCAVAEANLALLMGDDRVPPTPLPTLGKRFLEPRRPLGRALRAPPLRCPSQAEARFPRKCLGCRWTWGLAGHRGERFQGQFSETSSIQKSTWLKMSPRGLNITSKWPNLIPGWGSHRSNIALR